MLVIRVVISLPDALSVNILFPLDMLKLPLRIVVVADDAYGAGVLPLQIAISLIPQVGWYARAYIGYFAVSGGAE
jgi:hypothetical protein